MTKGLTRKTAVTVLIVLNSRGLMWHSLIGNLCAMQVVGAYIDHVFVRLGFTSAKIEM